jgi:mono/diheme cytochrome c family protein
MLRYFFLTLFLVVAAVVSLAGFRGETNSEPPIQIFPDMKVQPKYVPQHESEFFADGRAARQPVDGTVPIGYAMPGIYSTNAASNSRVFQGVSGFSNATDYLNTGKIGGSYGDGFPVSVSSELLERGRQRFNINCAICHGATAVGDGIVKQFGLNTVASLQDARIRTMPDGQIFNTITHGKNTMGAYGSNLTVEDRWAVIAYLRALQRSQNGRLEDAPEAVRNDLEKQTSVKK